MAVGLAPRMGLDMGTNKTVVWAGKRVAYDEPTLLAVNTQRNRVLYYGKAAAERTGKMKQDTEMLKPMRRGAIADYAATVFYLKKVLAASLRFRVLKPVIVAGVPIQLSSVESRALCDAAREAGAGGIFLVPSTLATLWGFLEDPEDPTGSLVVDIGAGVTDVSVIASNQLIVGRTIPIGGDDITLLAERVMDVSYGVRMGRNEAAAVKMDVGLGYYEDEMLEKRRNDPDHKGGFQNVRISKRQVAEFLLQGLEPLFSGIINTLEETPPELFEDIFRKGLILSGGSSLLPGLRRRMQDRLNLNVTRLPEPSLSVIQGIGKILSRFGQFREYFDEQRAMA